MSSTRYYPVQTAAVSTAASGNSTLVAATASRRIRVHQLSLVPTAAVVAQIQSGAGGAALTGAAALIAGTPWTLPFSERGWFDTAIGALLNLNLGGAVQVSGVVGYSVR